MVETIRSSAAFFCLPSPTFIHTLIHVKHPTVFTRLPGQDVNQEHTPFVLPVFIKSKKVVHDNVQNNFIEKMHIKLTWCHIRNFLGNSLNEICRAMANSTKTPGHTVPEFDIQPAPIIVRLS